MWVILCDLTLIVVESRPDWVYLYSKTKIRLTDCLWSYTEHDYHPLSTNFVGNSGKMESQVLLMQITWMLCEISLMGFFLLSGDSFMLILRVEFMECRCDYRFLVCSKFGLNVRSCSQ